MNKEFSVVRFENEDQEISSASVEDIEMEVANHSTILSEDVFDEGTEANQKLMQDCKAFETWAETAEPGERVDFLDCVIECVLPDGN